MTARLTVATQDAANNLVRWVERAACAGMDPGIFDLEDTDEWHRERAVAICRGCPVIAECLAYAMTTEQGGKRDRGMIKGGLTPGQRARLARYGHPGEPTDHLDDDTIGQPVPANCRDCKRRLRPNHMLREDAYGTVKHAARGLCTRCWRADTGNHGSPAIPTDCGRCGEPMRPYRATLQQLPGTVRHKGRGLCHGCWRPTDRIGDAA